ncbi:MAG: hypothetical protein ABI831_07905 [Betaproteobacteria bacterium]
MNNVYKMKTTFFIVMLLCSAAHATADDSPIPEITPAAKTYNAGLELAMVQYHNSWCEGTTAEALRCQDRAQATWRKAITALGASYFKVPNTQKAVGAARANAFAGGSNRGRPRLNE